jgi:hypothetical protein
MGRRTAKQTERTALFMAFPDGVYHYVCAECDAHCCRGQGFAGNLRREMTQLLTLYPALGSAAVSRSGDIVTFATPSGRCHFLDGDNLCRIEKDHGKALKPGVCSLFPFNVFTRIGKVVAVSPHFMCPLRLQLPARPGEVEGTHAKLAAAVFESGLLTEPNAKARQSEAMFHPSMNAETTLQRETEFRDACSAALGHQSFRALLKAQSEDDVALDAFISRAVPLLGYEDTFGDQPRDLTDDLLMAMASPLRLSLLRLGSEEIIRVLALGEVVLRRVAALSDQPPTLQGAHQIITSVMHALRLLARADEPFELKPRASVKSPQFSDPEMTFAAFITLREVQNSTGILEALEKAVTPSLSVADRSILLIQLGHKLETESAPLQKKRAGVAKPVELATTAIFQ